MTEAQWLACDDPGPMLEFLRGRASDRKLRLFAVACCRRIWPLLTDERSRRAVEVAERYADGVATREEMVAKHFDASDVAYATVDDEGDASALHAAYAAYAATDARPDSAAAYAAGDASPASRRDTEQTEQTLLLRDIFPNPFRGQPTIDPAVLSWNNGAVVRLARDIYEANAWERMLESGRMLEQAGCRDQDILRHCREQGQVHTRGCWLIDLILN